MKELGPLGGAHRVRPPKSANVQDITCSFQVLKWGLFVDGALFGPL